jgi:hypothetical protein
MERFSHAFFGVGRLLLLARWRELSRSADRRVPDVTHEARLIR